MQSLWLLKEWRQLKLEEMMKFREEIYKYKLIKINRNFNIKNYYLE